MPDWPKLWPKKAKIVSRGLENQTRPLFHMVSSTENDFIIKLWNLVFTVSKLLTFSPIWPKLWPKKAKIVSRGLECQTRALFHIILSAENEFIMWFRAYYIKWLYITSKDKNLKYKDQSKTSLGLSWSSGTLTGQFGLNFSNERPNFKMLW